MEFPSYPKVHALGHKEIAGIFDGRVSMQEKIDGSQINFAWDEEGNLHVKSKGTWQFGGPDGRVEPDKMFSQAVEYLKELTPDPWVRGLITFRGEMITKPKQNVLLYERVPEGFIVLFDVLTMGWGAIDPQDVASLLPFEWVPAIPVKPGDAHEMIAKLLAQPPLLGGDMREGIVVKNYEVFTRDGKIAMGKYVQPAFKEKHEKVWGENNKSQRDIVQSIIDTLNTEARFAKAVQHLRENGEIEDTPRDIGKLMREIKRDTLEEEREWIVETIANHFMPQIERGLGRGAAEWYKDLLFEQNKENV